MKHKIRTIEQEIDRRKVGLRYTVKDTNEFLEWWNAL